MQLSAVLAQPPVAAQAGPSPFLNVLTTLRGPRPAASEAAPPAAASAAAASIAAAVEASQPSLGQKLLGGVAESQNKYLQNQQMLAVISASLGARFSMIAKGVWAHLRGTAQQAEPQPTPQADVQPAG